MAYFVGLDSGGTKTECWLGDESRVLAQATCETVKLTRVSQEIATERMRTLLAAVSASSGVALADVKRTCVGIAGYSIAEVRDWAERVVSETVAGTVEVCDDAEIALDAAFAGGPGILVIGGTGSAVLGRAGDGTRFSAGGWGPGIGDEGSGYWIGREALRRSFGELDRSGNANLLHAIRTAWGVRDLGELVAFANGRPGPDLSVLTPVVVRCAEAGDALAAAVLDDAGTELACQVELVWARMQRQSEPSARVAFTGSVLEKIAHVNAAMRRGIEQRCPRLSVMDQAVHATAGALWRARHRVVSP